VLERELGKLKARSDVLALGVCGSVAQNDIWPGSDLDIEVVVKGDRPKEIFTTEQEVSVDYGYFGENQLSEIPYDTRPVHDPSGILTRELESRVRDEVVRKALDAILDRSQKVLGWAQIALAEDPYSALAWVTSASQWLAEIFTLSAGLNWTHRRVVSRLEKATTRLHRDDILQDYGKLMGFPRLWRERENCYRTSSWDIEKSGATSRGRMDPSIWSSSLTLKPGSRIGSCHSTNTISGTLSTLSIPNSVLF